MKFKVGDKVKIRSDLESNTIYGTISFNDIMTSYLDKEAMIDGLDAMSICYFLDIDDGRWAWSDSMLECNHQWEDGKCTQCGKWNIEYKGFVIGDKVRIKSDLM